VAIIIKMQSDKIQETFENKLKQLKDFLAVN